MDNNSGASAAPISRREAILLLAAGTIPIPGPRNQATGRNNIGHETDGETSWEAEGRMDAILPTPIILTATPAATIACIRYILHVLARSAATDKKTAIPYFMGLPWFIVWSRPRRQSGRMSIRSRI